MYHSFVLLQGPILLFTVIEIKMSEKYLWVKTRTLVAHSIRYLPFHQFCPNKFSVNDFSLLDFIEPPPRRMLQTTFHNVSAYCSWHAAPHAYVHYVHLLGARAWILRFFLNEALLTLKTVSMARYVAVWLSICLSMPVVTKAHTVLKIASKYCVLICKTFFD